MLCGFGGDLFTDRQDFLLLLLFLISSLLKRKQAGHPEPRQFGILWERFQETMLACGNVGNSSHTNGETQGSGGVIRMGWWLKRFGQPAEKTESHEHCVTGKPMFRDLAITNAEIEREMVRWAKGVQPCFRLNGGSGSCLHGQSVSIERRSHRGRRSIFWEWVAWVC